MDSLSLPAKINSLAEVFRSVLLKTEGELPESAPKEKADPPSVYKDTQTKAGLENYGSFNAFHRKASENPHLYHLRVDSNDHRHLNAEGGYLAGDQKINELAQMVRKHVDEQIGRDRARAWRLEGGKFHIATDNPEALMRFARAFRADGEARVPVRGQHNWSVKFGFGKTIEDAEKALRFAADAKNAGNHPPGQAQTYAHNLIPGMEGAIPLGEQATRLRLVP